MVEQIKINKNAQGQFLRTISDSVTNDQWIREFFKNASEAIEEYKMKYPNDKNFKPEIIFDKNKFLEELGLNKICVIDNGIFLSK